MGIELGLRGVVWLCGDGIALGIQAHDPGLRIGQAVEQGRVCDQHRDLRILQHEGEPLGWIGGIERQIGATSLANAEQRDNHLWRAFQANAHHPFGTDAKPAQMMRQTIGTGIEFGVAEAVLLEHHRRRSRRPVHLCRKQLRQGGAGDLPCRVVPVQQDGAPLGSGQNIQAPIDRSGSATAASSDRTNRSTIAATLAAQTGRADS